MIEALKTILGLYMAGFVVYWIFSSLKKRESPRGRIYKNFRNIFFICLIISGLWNLIENNIKKNEIFKVSINPDIIISQKNYPREYFENLKAEFFKTGDAAKLGKALAYNYRILRESIDKNDLKIYRVALRNCVTGNIFNNIGYKHNLKNCYNEFFKNKIIFKEKYQEKKSFPFLWGNFKHLNTEIQNNIMNNSFYYVASQYDFIDDNIVISIIFEGNYDNKIGYFIASGLIKNISKKTGYTTFDKDDFRVRKLSQQEIDQIQKQFEEKLKNDDLSED
ncbi:hypothetical protein BKH41_03700 [Helicobacter sp. 12S02232-10]|uniref:hypothetical protein n=1 Tax=Helicobacter sp. 12S02232-10 TaxID=1476197 RepID=UPI000BA741D9|nr:hypothetical protein [Helicobacter sp. 12S02232-10]PAF49197.1 hypothetical protein BKH41_03700 [Helicobacter sp. 12S02232-10]